MEGVNFLPIMATFLAFLIFGITTLVAIGMLFFQKSRQARLLFSGGFLCGTVIVALSLLSFFERQYRHNNSTTLIVISIVTLCLAGAGQYLAARRNGLTFVMAFACSTIALILMCYPQYGPFRYENQTSFELMLEKLGVTPLSAASLPVAVASLGIAFLLPYFLRKKSFDRLPVN